MTDQNAGGGWPVARDLSGDHFADVALSLVDLHRTRLLRGETILSGITFENCRIEGPAVMLVVGGCSFDATNFGPSNSDIRSLVLRPASPKGVVGAIPVRDCRFINCQLFAIGYTGSDAFLNQLLALGGPVQ